MKITNTVLSKLGVSSLFLFISLAGISLEAGINLRNGNYHVKYSDIIVKTGEENFRVDRDYNSHHRHSGIFGNGWTSEIETRVLKFKDRLELIEFGVKPSIIFSKITPVEFRNTIGEKILINSKNEYRLESSNQSIYEFNSNGALEKKIYPSGYYVELSYQDNKLKSIQDRRGRQVKLFFTGKKITKIKSSTGKKSIYKYKGDFLISVMNEDKNLFSYDYSKNGLLSKIKVNDKFYRSIEYDSKTAHVKKIIESDKKQTSYKYTSSKDNALDFKVSVTKDDGVANFHYFISNRADGSEYVKKIDFISSKKKIKTTYSRECELPILVETKNLWEKLEYNKDCLLLSKQDSKGNKLSIKYIKNKKLIQKVELNDYVVNYKYNKRYKPSVVNDSKKRKIKISYDFYGRSRKIEVESPKQKKREVVFDYSQNQDDKFILIVNKKNKVQAYYDENREIVFDEDIQDEAENEINIVFSTMNYLLNAHQF